MTGWRDLDGVRQPHPLDDWTADRLLAGMVDPDDAPPGYAGLARTLGQARGPVEAGELAGRELIVAAVTAAVADASPPTTVSTSLRRRPMLYRLLGTKVAAATITMVLLATGAAAATGSLPDPVQDAVSDVADAVGVTLPVAASDTAEGHVADEADRAARKAAHEADLADQKAQKAAEKVLHEGEDASDDELDGAEHGIGKGSPNPSGQGDEAHLVRDAHLGAVAARQAGHDTAAGDDTQLDDEKGIPTSQEGKDAHAARDARLGTVAEQKAERDALKAERPADEADDDSGDVADDDQGDDDQGDAVADDDADDDSDDVADDDDAADDDEDAVKDKSGHGDEHEDDDAEDAPAAQPAV